MATFYIVPSRHQLGERFAELLGALFPDIRYTPWDWPDLAAMIADLAQAQADAHVIFREDLDDRLSVKESLMRSFGAGLDDEIVEIHFGPGLTQFLHQRWATEKRARAA